MYVTLGQQVLETKLRWEGGGASFGQVAICILDCWARMDGKGNQFLFHKWHPLWHLLRHDGEHKLCLKWWLPLIH
jgi:hypothetical protein